jgi:site-specific recombinase XerD
VPDRTPAGALLQFYSATAPQIVSAVDTERFLNFFATQIENDNTRAAYLRAAREFLGWCERRELGALAEILPIHVAAWIKELKATYAVPTVKLRLAALRHLFVGRWLPSGCSQMR